MEQKALLSYKYYQHHQKKGKKREINFDILSVQKSFIIRFNHIPLYVRFFM